MTLDIKMKNAMREFEAVMTNFGHNLDYTRDVNEYLYASDKTNDMWTGWFCNLMANGFMEK